MLNKPFLFQVKEGRKEGRRCSLSGQEADPEACHQSTFREESKELRDRTRYSTEARSFQICEMAEVRIWIFYVKGVGGMLS